MNATEKALQEEARRKATEANQKANNDRLAKMEAIADNNEENPETEMPEVEEPVWDKDTEVEDEPRKARALQEEGPTPAEEEIADEKVINGEKHYLQVVNGKEVWQTLKEIRQTAQKVSSADEYLRTASESVKNAARLGPSKDDPVSLERDEVRKLLAEVALGNEEAIEKLATVITRPSVSPDVLSTIDQRLSFRTELARLEDEYKDLLQDEDLGDVFRSKLDRLKREAPNTKLSDAYHGIGKALRKRFSPQTKLQDKLERKRTLPQPLNAAARQSAPEEAEGEEDVNSVIESIAKARGQTPHVHRRQ